MATPIRRVVTGNTPEGKAIFTSDETFEPVLIPSGDAEFSLLWTTAKVPVDLNDTTDGRKREAGTTLNGGSVIRVVDMLPGASSPFHRSSSIDYGIVISGSIELELDEGQVKTIYPGEVIVQQGTIHLWRNLSKIEKCRIIFILTEAIPFEVEGQPLPDVMEH
jgi:quercetin dioxygenase-like cupin family protein